MHFVSVVGARSQFVKLARVSEALSVFGVGHSIIHSGQHYNVDIIDALSRDFNLPEPTRNLSVGSGSHAHATAGSLEKDDKDLIALKSDLVVEFDDTDMTVAAALVAVKRGLPLVHVEAGLGSFDRRMPEEADRFVTDQASDLLYAPTEATMSNPAREGLKSRAALSGDALAQICLHITKRVVRLVHPNIDLPTEDFILVTLHRTHKTDHPKPRSQMVTAFSWMPIPVLLAANPRLCTRPKSSSMSLEKENV